MVKAIIVSKRDKLLIRFKTLPTDFTWLELKAMLEGLGFTESQAGKTSGSRVRFYQNNHPPIMLHKPHPGNILKQYQMKYIKEYLQNEGLI